MTRCQVLRKIRRMRFEEACGGWRSRRLTQEEAARLPGVCERTACSREGGGSGTAWTATSDDGRTLHARKAARAEAPQPAIYDALGIHHPPGGTRKMSSDLSPSTPL